MRRIREIHVAPLGYERDRILLPATEHEADLIYLLEETDPSWPSPEYHAQLKRDLRDAGIEVETREADLHDMYAVLGTVTTVVSEHEDDIVRVNVSSGTKLAEVGATLACMATGATAYFVEPEAYAFDVEQRPLTTGYEHEVVLPSYPIESPSRDQVAVMDYLETKNTQAYTAKKSDIIEFAEASSLSFLADNEPANDKAKFALLNANVVDPLLENDYITVSDVGRTKQVELTETGEHALQAFRHKL